MFVRNITILIGNDNKSPVDEDSVGHVLSHGDATVIVKFDVAYSRLYRDSDVSNSRIQPDVFDFAQITKQRLHLIFGRLWGDIRNLYDFR